MPIRIVNINQADITHWDTANENTNEHLRKQMSCCLQMKTHTNMTQKVVI